MLRCPVQVSACLIAVLLLAGCAEERRIPLRLTQIRIAPNNRLSTSDPVAKNRALRQKGVILEDTSVALGVPRSRVSRLVLTETGGLEISSLDQGIAIHHPDVPDDAPTVLRRWDEYQLYWWSRDSDQAGIYRARSADGYTWSKPEMILSPSTVDPEASRDAARTAEPAVLVVNGAWYLYYTGSKTPHKDNEIFCARSSDGITWLKHSTHGDPNRPTPVLPNSDRDGTYGVGHPTACYKDGVFHLWYTDRRRGKGGLWFVRSVDGLHFADPAQVAPDVENADVKYCPALKVFVMVYGEIADANLYIAVSKDGVSWEAHDGTRAIATGPPETVHFSPGLLSHGRGHMEPRTRVFYTGGISSSSSPDMSTWEIEATWVSITR